MTVPSERLDPNDLLRDGTSDSATLHVTWLTRKLFLPLLLAGVIVAVQVTQNVVTLGDEIRSRIDSLNTPTDFFSALASPFSLIIVALALRIVAELMALILAFPLTRWSRPSDYDRVPLVGRYWRLLSDRVHFAGAFRSLRWTYAVRQAAADRLGPIGRVLEVLSPALSWAAALLAVILVAVVATTA